jgi:acyl-CoA dehydrogenase
MDTDYSAEQETLRASVRRFLEERTPLAWVRARWHEPGGLPGDVWQGLVELGLAGLLVPAEHGGFGGNMVDAGVVLEELGRCVSPLPFLSSCVGATHAVHVLGADGLLASLADGSRVGALALEEAERSPLRWRSSAVRARDGRLQGSKSHVLGASEADFVVVVAEDGVYAVDTDATGVRVTPDAQVDGSRRLARVDLDAAPARRLGDVEALAPSVDRMVVGLCLDGLGAATRVLEHTVEYARERRQFDRPIGSFQAVAHLCADMLSRVELARAGLHYALFALDHESAEEAHRAAAMAKAFCAEALPRVGADAIQVFGGVGYTWEHDAHLYYKRLLGLEQLLGGPDLWLDELASLVV